MNMTKALALGGTTWCLVSGPASAQDADFYKGRTIEMIVSSGAGDAVDLNARAAARYLPNYLPGRPVIIVRNMLGAGSLLATNHLYNVAAKDGTVLGSIIAGFVLNQMIDGRGVQYD